MNLLDVFMELEDSYLQESYNDRQALIDEIISLGYNYKFDKYTDQQLFNIRNWAVSQQSKKDIPEDDYSELALEMSYDCCENCGRELNPLGECPTCDLGDDSIYDELDEAISDNDNTVLNEWKSVATSSSTLSQQSQTPPPTNSPQLPQTPQPQVSSPTTQSVGKNIVTIVYDNKAHKLRARADDGVHGEANVAFPNNLRNTEGQQYEVEELTWNGKNYRASGNIKLVNSVVNTQNNINENINKENPEMNFTNVFEELSRLYEADEPEATEVPEEDIPVDEPVVEEPVEETSTEEAPKQVVLECSKCGALVIKDEADVVIDEETDLANVKDECAFCEEAAGYTIVGAVVPFEDTDADADADEEDVAESLTEGKIKDSLKKVATRLGADGATIMRSFAELISEVLPEKAGDALYDAAEYVENKAALKALMNGNEKVLNTLTVEDIEELKQDIEAYKKAKAAKKNGEAVDEDLDAAQDKVDNDDVNEPVEAPEAAEPVKELLDVNLDLDARGFGGKGNDVSVL